MDLLKQVEANKKKKKIRYAYLDCRNREAPFEQIIGRMNVLQAEMVCWK